MSLDLGGLKIYSEMGCVKSRSLDEVSSNSAENEALLPASYREEEGEYTVTSLPASPTPNSTSINSSFQEDSGQGTGTEKFRRLSSDVMNVRNLTNDRSYGLPSNGEPPVPRTRHSYPQAQQPSSRSWSHDHKAARPVNLRDSNHSVEVDGLTRSNVMNGRVSESTGIPALLEIKSSPGKELLIRMKNAYKWREKFDHPSQDFLALMDRLYMECQLHLTSLSSRGDMDSKREVDAIVSEMISLRNHWGPRLLPNSICNAFVRERIPLVLGENQRQFRIDCAQFFEPVPFYGSQHQASNPGELMKLYRFSVYDVSKNEVVLRYYLERSNVTQLYHVLCFTCESCRGQVHPYGSECPSYWEIRQHMTKDVCSRLLSALSGGGHPAPIPHASTIFPTQTGGPTAIEVAN